MKVNAAYGGGIWAIVFVVSFAIVNNAVWGIEAPQTPLPCATPTPIISDTPGTIRFMGIKLGRMKEPIQPLQQWIDVIIRVIFPWTPQTPDEIPPHCIAPTPTGSSPTTIPTIPPVSPSPTPVTAAAACETRGVWLNLNPNGFGTQAKRAEILANIKRANLNTVFLGSYTLKGNFGWTDKAIFDAFLQEAQTAGLNVSYHVWLSSMSRTGNAASMDYTKSAEQQAHKAWCADWIIAYPELDGIQLDNVRYESGQMDDGKRKGIADTVKACNEGIRSASGGKKRYLTSFVDNVDPLKQKQTNASLWFNAWFAANGSNPNNPYRMGGTQYYPSNLKVDPISWIKGGYFDALMPGDYTSDPALWSRRIPLWKSLIGTDFDKIVFSVAWMPDKPSVVWPDKRYSGGGAHAANVVTMIKDAQAAGMKGFSIFQFGKPPSGVTDLQLAKALGDPSGPFSQPKPSCLSSM